MKVKVRRAVKVAGHGGDAVLPIGAAARDDGDLSGFFGDHRADAFRRRSDRQDADGAVLRLTPAKEWQSGSAFGTELIGVQQFTSIVQLPDDERRRNDGL